MVSLTSCYTTQKCFLKVVVTGSKEQGMLTIHVGNTVNGWFYVLQMWCWNCSRASTLALSGGDPPSILLLERVQTQCLIFEPLVSEKKKLQRTVHNLESPLCEVIFQGIRDISRDNLPKGGIILRNIRDVDYMPIRSSDLLSVRTESTMMASTRSISISCFFWDF